MASSAYTRSLRGTGVRGEAWGPRPPWHNAHPCACAPRSRGVLSTGSSPKPKCHLLSLQHSCPPRRASSKGLATVSTWLTGLSQASASSPCAHDGTHLGWLPSTSKQTTPHHRPRTPLHTPPQRDGQHADSQARG